MRRRLSFLACAMAAAIALPLIPTGPASAVPTAPFSAHVWAYAPTTPSYTLPNGGYTFNGSGGTITITRGGTGRYDVRIAGQATEGGVAHAVAYGTTTRFCKVGVWYRSGPDLVVPVRCFTAQGDPVDTMFLANFTANFLTGTAAVTYLDADWPTRSSYSPTRFFDSSGGAPVIRRVATGTYAVRLPALDDVSAAPTVHQVTAVGSTAVHCQPRGRFSTGEYHVWCQDTDGVRADQRFALTMARRADLLAVPSGRYGHAHIDGSGPSVLSATNSGAGPVTVTRPAVGRYTVVFGGLGGAPGHSVAHIHDSGFATCGVRGWYDRGADKVVEVQCFMTQTGEPRSADVVVAFRR